MANDSCRTDAHQTDPPLLKENSGFYAFKTSRFHYQGIRVFFRQHVKAKQLPAPLPLLVCIPGLGGSVAQFHPLLSSLVDLAPCLAVDWPGCGRSDYTVASWEAYTPQALSELLEAVIDAYRDSDAGQGVVLIGHSMGTCLAASMANLHVKHTTTVARHVVGLVAICPLSGPGDKSKYEWALLRALFWIPECIVSLWRAWDGIGGPQSASVARFVGQDADAELKMLQYRFNQQSRTPVWRRMAYGLIPWLGHGNAVGGVPGLDIWAGLSIPIYLIAGQDDHLTPPSETDKIVQAIKSASSDWGAEAPPPDLDGTEVPPQLQHAPKVVQTIVMPSPANHALLYMPQSARALAGLISDFVAANVTGRLSLAWQLQYLSREGKWDVKNLGKWRSVKPVSDSIGPKGKPIFRAMKTLREADEVHCPKIFVEKWGALIKDVIDISKDQPVYDPRGLERSGIHYHKFPTVSKVPPPAHEVEAFVRRVDGLREAQHVRARQENWQGAHECVIGVHCHYGFNRTGYLIVCYLVERCGFGLADAIDTFAQARPNGIRHSHFLDRLYVRYNIDAVRT
ncbi:hypothetical protein CDD81_5141 [Ophiocordyceps australis]|uniref:Tyrosine specific protein phosphatases domain-containing protein n=1 Tax=Ophiocordyceps australis TaxID=1399860 RepID=A0A2C5XQ54_9HYPO|nr:hypothetical protein CDD81_5141 [Ophiocordyceps australis]